eukprot:15446489-Alexandrium_andersonii.AAC.1
MPRRALFLCSGTGSVGRPSARRGGRSWASTATGLRRPDRRQHPDVGRPSGVPAGAFRRDLVPWLWFLENPDSGPLKTRE